MMLTTTHLDAFLAVSRNLNFTKAAAELHVTQSALSQRILNLEKELGTTLFIRDRGGIKLTETANELVRYCRIKNQLEEEFLNSLKNKTAEKLAGVLRIGAFSSVMSSLVLPAFAPFFKDNSSVSFHAFNREMSHLPDMLKRGEIDYMLLDHKLDWEDLEQVHLFDESYVLTEKKNYDGPDIYLDHDEQDTTTFKYLRFAGVKQKNIKRQYLDEIHGIIEAVKLGVGRAVLPLHLVKQEKNLQILSPQTVLKVPVYLSFYSQPYYSKLHQSVLKYFQSIHP
ncbi:LysR family transcriptional regulator [Bdellovibrio sp. 22V]|uniref:LysR family transcriptional regulator n=1 Tax=Bdellovibrio TaxID=958 RepID=UPI002542E09A|nr:LysR family transcriptional regulator [Bdellovibrio sp. 22V]WII73200.1 LysR family transcriptional regulator [Bdellovibrio sp. 22V]